MVSLKGCRGKSPEKKRPSILFLFTDDQRFDTVHALNNPAIQTPNMDRLVRNGMAFTRAHIMGGTSAAVCMPSRAMLLTGISLSHLKDQGLSIPDEHIMLPEHLKNQGYKTCGIGKWHNGREAYARSFTHGGKIFFGGMSDHLKVPVYDFDPTGTYASENQYISKKFSSELFSDEAIQFLENQTDKQPFFLYISYTAPHDPRMAPKEFAEMYPPNQIELPANFLPEHPFDNGELQIRDENLAPFPRTPEIVKQHIAAYYAMITHLDYHIGRVLDALEQQGLADDTIIVFAGDNGLAVGQHGLLGKQNLYDHSVRVPLIFCGKGIPRGARSDSLCYLNDIYPTLCNLLNLPVPKSVEAKSLAPIFKDKNAKIRDAVFLAYKTFQRAIRTDDNWKLIEYHVNGEHGIQLFDLNEDPFEMNNLVGKPQHQRKKQQLSELLYNCIKEFDDLARIKVK